MSEVTPRDREEKLLAAIAEGINDSNFKMAAPSSEATTYKKAEY